MINYKGATLNNGYRIDILVEDSIVSAYPKSRQFVIGVNLNF